MTRTLFPRVQKSIHRESLKYTYNPFFKATMPAALKSGERNPVDETGLCLLSLDGGGVCGLSILFVLKSIMD